MACVLVHYGEIALKGRNRPWFIARLVRNLREATADLDVASVRPLMGRIEIALGPRADWPELRERLARVFGIENFVHAWRTNLDLDELSNAIVRSLADVTAASFRISARRADKRYPLTSPQIEREIGRRVQQARGWRVNLSEPELDIRVEILSETAYYSFETVRGAGGLPTGVSGRVVCLLSGGIDSPVAAYRMMRRGCTVVPVHFHSYPIVSLTSQEKVRDICQQLARHQLSARYFLVPFGDLQQQVVLHVPPPMRVVIYRRFMMRIGEAIARRKGARALVTGEVVGQVASQTLENLAVIDAVASMPVLRPLIGMDKSEITDEARRIGTFSISIIPDEDCCQLFTPRHPTTRARLEEVAAAEAALPVTDMVESAVAAMSMEEVRFPPRAVSAA